VIERRIAKRRRAQARHREILIAYLGGAAGYEVADRHGITAAKASLILDNAFRWFAFACDRDAEIDRATRLAGVDLGAAAPKLATWHQRRPHRRPGPKPKIRPLTPSA
jgi:hypothetical protein